MKLNKDVNNLEVEGEDPDGFRATIAEENLPFIFDLLSRQQYRDPIGSIVREITSNCFDAHIEAGVDDPVIIQFGEDGEGKFIAFIDEGIGMTPERVRKFMSYGSSTKNLANDQIGGFGLGGKSPLAYSDVFYLTTKKDGIEYQYIIFKGKSVPQVDLLFSESTLDRNGTTIKIYFKSNEDQIVFRNKCREQLKYFDNVVFRGIDIDNNYKIYEGVHFKYRKDQDDVIPRESGNVSTLSYVTNNSITSTTPSGYYITYNTPTYNTVEEHYNNGKQMHLVIGKVVYPIDWNQLKIPPINLPVAIKFNIGDLVVTPERESIRYIPIDSKETSDIIKEKIELVKRELKKLYNKQDVVYYYNIQNFITTLKYGYSFLLIGNNSIDLQSIDIKPRIVLKGFEKWQDVIKEGFLKSWKFHYDTLRKKGKGSVKNQNDVDFNMLDRVLYENKNGKKNLIKNSYLLTQHDEFRVGRLKFEGYKSFAYKYRKYCKSIKDLVELKNALETYIKKRFHSYDKLEVPKEYVQKITEQKKKRKEGEITVVDWANKDKTRSFVEPNFIRHHIGFVIYGYEEDIDLLTFFTDLLANSKYNTERGKILGPGAFYLSKAVKIFKVSQSIGKRFKNIKNAVYVKDFIGDNKVFKHFATALIIRKERKYLVGRELNKSGFKFEDIMEYVLPNYRESFDKCTDFIDNYGRTIKIDETIADSIIDTAKQFNLIDQEIYNEHRKLNNYINKLELINYIFIPNSIVHLIVDYLVLKDKKVDSIWTKPEPYEVELVKEMIDKINYLKEVNECYPYNDIQNENLYHSLNNYYNYVKCA